MTGGPAAGAAITTLCSSKDGGHTISWASAMRLGRFTISWCSRSCGGNTFTMRVVRFPECLVWPGTGIW